VPVLSRPACPELSGARGAIQGVYSDKPDTHETDQPQTRVNNTLATLRLPSSRDCVVRPVPLAHSGGNLSPRQGITKVLAEPTLV
jgi:hypothetical protein